MGETIATHKKAYRDYQLTDKWECGIALNGAEVKSIRSGHVNFKDTYARIQKGEVFVYNLHINPYEAASYENDEADRPRKLLLHAREIKKIIGYVDQKGFVLVPTKIYFNNRGFVKLEIALGKGKKFYDKRETIKKRKIDRDIARAVREQQKR